MHRKHIYFVTFVIVLAIAAFILWPLFAYSVPEPQYTSVTTRGQIEVRAYPEMVVAEVKVKGDRDQAITEGFQILADYISGQNHEKMRIEMTAPVMQKGTRIDMNSPVVQQQAGDGWAVLFVMPEGYSKSMLPIPDNKDINITTVPAERYVVIRFSGRNTDKNIKDHFEMLLDFVKQEKLQVDGPPILAFYNPPWVLPLLRRNEILLKLNQ